MRRRSYLPHVPDELSSLLRQRRLALGLRVLDAARLARVPIGTWHRAEDGDPNTPILRLLDVLEGAS